MIDYTIQRDQDILSLATILECMDDRFKASCREIRDRANVRISVRSGAAPCQDSAVEPAWSVVQEVVDESGEGWLFTSRMCSSLLGGKINALPYCYLALFESSANLLAAESYTGLSREVPVRPIGGYVAGGVRVATRVEGTDFITETVVVDHIRSIAGGRHLAVLIDRNGYLLAYRFIETGKIGEGRIEFVGGAIFSFTS